MVRGERGAVVAIVSRLWVGENVGRDDARMRASVSIGSWREVAREMLTNAY